MSVVELLEAILIGPYIRFLGRVRPEEVSEKMSLKRPRFDTLRGRMDVLRQNQEDMTSRNINVATDLETDRQNKRYITPEFVPSDADFDSDSN